MRFISRPLLQASPSKPIWEAVLVSGPRHPLPSARHGQAQPVCYLASPGDKLPLRPPCPPVSLRLGLGVLDRDSDSLFRINAIQEHQGSFTEQTSYLISYKVQFTVAFDSSFASTSRLTWLGSFHTGFWAAPVSPEWGPVDTLLQLRHLGEGHLAPEPPTEALVTTVTTSSGLSSKSERSACPDHTTTWALRSGSVQNTLTSFQSQVCRKVCKMPYAPFLEFCTCILLSQRPWMTCSQDQFTATVGCIASTFPATWSKATSELLSFFAPFHKA